LLAVWKAEHKKMLSNWNKRVGKPHWYQYPGAGNFNETDKASKKNWWKSQSHLNLYRLKSSVVYFVI